MTHVETPLPRQRGIPAIPADTAGVSLPASDTLDLLTKHFWSGAVAGSFAAAVRNGVFDYLATARGESPFPSARQIALGRGLDEGILGRVLEVLRVAGLLRSDGEGFALVEGVAPFVTSSGSRSLVAYGEHLCALLEVYSRLPELMAAPAAPPLSHKMSKAFGLSDGSVDDILQIGIPFYNGSREVFASILSQLPSMSGLTILDVGSGLGALVDELASRGSKASVTMLDTLPVINAAKDFGAGRNRNAVDYRDADLCAWQPDKVFDVVVLSQVLHEFPEAIAAQIFEASTQALSPGGLLLFVGFIPDWSDGAVGDLVPALAHLNFRLELGADGGTLGWLKGLFAARGIAIEAIIRCPGSRTAILGRAR